MQKDSAARWRAAPLIGMLAAALTVFAEPVVAHAESTVYPGMKIIQGDPTNSLTCTLGFVDPQARIGVTAGHCGGDGPVFNSDGNRIGRMAIARTNIESEGKLTATDYRIDYEGIIFDDGVSINNVLPNGLQLGLDNGVTPRIGLPVCRNGVTTGEACGTVASLGNGWFLVDGLPVDHGDSGSPVYTITSPGRAAIVGIVSARYKANRTGAEATVALSWPTVVRQMRDDLANGRGTRADDTRTRPALPAPPPPGQTLPPPMEPQPPSLVGPGGTPMSPPLPPDAPAPSGPAKTVVA